MDRCLERPESVIETGCESIVVQSAATHLIITIDALYDYTLYVRGAYNGPYIRIKHHIYVRAYNHRITNGQRIIPSYDETEFTAHLLLPHPPVH